VLLRLPGQGNRELIAISATSTGYGKLHFEVESTALNNVQILFYSIELSKISNPNILAIEII